jgi:hypothetical protein
MVQFSCERRRLSKELNLRYRIILSRMGRKGMSENGVGPMSDEQSRGERLQIMLSPDELTVVDDFRFKARMPSRAAAVRELLKRGLAAEGYALAAAGTKSSEYGVIGNGDGAAKSGGRKPAAR